MKLCLNLRAKFDRYLVKRQSFCNKVAPMNKILEYLRNSLKSCQGGLAMFLADESLNDLNAMDQFFDSEEVFVR